MCVCVCVCVCVCLCVYVCVRGRVGGVVRMNTHCSQILNLYWRLFPNSNTIMKIIFFPMRTYPLSLTPSLPPASGRAIRDGTFFSHLVVFSFITFKWILLSRRDQESHIICLLPDARNFCSRH